MDILLQQNGFIEIPLFFNILECNHYIQLIDTLFSHTSDEAFDIDGYQRMRITDNQLSTIVTNYLNNYKLTNLYAYHRWFPTKYIIDGGLDIHCDGNAFDEDKTSTYTIIIYLNDDYQGGRTIFVDDYDEEDITNQHIIQPKQGLALILKQDLLHYAEKIHNGCKYILRGDLFVNTDL